MENTIKTAAYKLKKIEQYIPELLRVMYVTKGEIKTNLKYEGTFDLETVRELRDIIESMEDSLDFIKKQLFDHAFIALDELADEFEPEEVDTEIEE